MTDREIQRVLGAVQFERCADSFDPLGCCPGCNGVFPSWLGLKSAWEHVCKWDDAHRTLRGNIAQLLASDTSGETASLSDATVRRLFDAFGLRLEPTANLPTGLGRPEPVSAGVGRIDRSPTSSSTSRSRHEKGDREPNERQEKQEKQHEKQQEKHGEKLRERQNERQFDRQRRRSRDKSRERSRERRSRSRSRRRERRRSDSRNRRQDRHDRGRRRR
uniref:Uncharacterized protein n=1 Tax=Noctiluca scintillans TaxID=2966 RepID=A0A7S1ABX0_NOCSC|mmetsp:Transcript_3905/g.10822  ORF Transcript_3905/g.10822 Transcript_3905/m.10822 type:complete len:218 (+) Transcript_3905:78-731(+)